MSTTIVDNYDTGRVRAELERALAQAGKPLSGLEPRELALIEDFHTLGRLATVALIDLAGVTSGTRVLDAGAGIGGTARLLAAEYGCRVTAVDLTPAYCEVAEWLDGLVGLAGEIDVRIADVTALPFADASFDVVISQHVQMNIADKARLYAEARRVLQPGGRLALWDVTAGPHAGLILPVPWATKAEQSHLVTRDELADLLFSTGFALSVWNDLTEAASAGMRALLSAPRQVLGLHVFVPDFAVKAENLVANLETGRASLTQAVLTAV